MQEKFEVSVLILSLGNKIHIHATIRAAYGGVSLSTKELSVRCPLFICHHLQFEAWERKQEDWSVISGSVGAESLKRWLLMFMVQ